MKKGIIVTLLIIFVMVSYIFVLMVNNKTFSKDTYVGVQNQEIFIPKYSFFKEELSMTVDVFLSLKTEKQLNEEINNYMSGFEYFKDNSTFGYKKGDLFIQSYEVVDNGFYRKIYITY